MLKAALALFAALLIAGCAATDASGTRKDGKKDACEACQAPLGADDEAFVCSYECTFCGPCTRSVEHVCPNCSGELGPRPGRGRGPVAPTDG